MTSIIFVCHGNICRSPMAEFVMKEIVKRKGLENRFFIDSAAVSREEIGNGVHPGTREKLREKGFPVLKHYARQITKEDYEKFDYIITMDRSNTFLLYRLLNLESNSKVHPLLSFAGMDRDIRDPWYTGNFEETFQDILKGCTELLAKLS